MKYIFYISLSFFLFSCELDNDEIRKRRWKYGEGYHLGHDFIDFKSGSFILRNDTILDNDSAIGIIYRTDRNILEKDNNEIYIQSSNTDEKGVYHDFGLAD